MAVAIASLALLGGMVGTVGAASAQSACLADTEPNDTPEQAGTLLAPACIEGTLPDEDQDLYLWSVSEADSLQPWTFSVDARPTRSRACGSSPSCQSRGRAPSRWHRHSSRWTTGQPTPGPRWRRTSCCRPVGSWSA